MFLFIDDAGNATQSATQPDSGDLERIDSGALRVFEFRLTEGFFEAVADTVEAETEDEDDTLELGWTKVTQ